MDVAAKLTSKGQITIPRAVRDALGLETGDSVLFRVDSERAVLTRTPNFIDLAGSVPVPPSKKGATFEEIRHEARRVRAKDRH